MPVLFVGHGAAGITLDPRSRVHQWMTAYGDTLRALAPRGLVIVSAHYIAEPVRITAAPTLQTIHDHPVGAVYNYAYPATGSPELAAEIAQLFAAAEIPAALDRRRGLDHGAWIPLSLLLPRGEVPVVQVSLHQSLAPELHLRMGRALAPLRDSGVIILASGGITHNQETFRQGYLSGADPERVSPASRAFAAWVEELIAGESEGVLSEEERERRRNTLVRFPSHPAAAAAHPSIEHFIPLFVALGAAEAAAELDRGGHADQRGAHVRVTKLHESYQHSLSLAAFRFDGGSVRQRQHLSPATA